MHDIESRGGFRYYGIWGQKYPCSPCFKTFIDQVILQILFRQNSNVSKLCTVAIHQSFVSSFYINELYRKKTSFNLFKNIILRVSMKST